MRKRRAVTDETLNFWHQLRACGHRLAKLLGDESDVLSVTNAARLEESEEGFVDSAADLVRLARDRFD